MKLLLAEDTADLNKAVSTVLEHYHYEVDSAYDGAQAEALIGANVYDVIILDIMMPKVDGLTVLKHMRENGDHTPVLLLTAKAEIDDRVAGLDSGADDYLTKPFAMKELLARIRSLSRRSDDYNTQELSFGNMVLKPEQEVLVSQNSINLSHRECQLLGLLMQSKKPLDSTYLAEKIWKNESASSDTVWLYISYLKGKIASINADVKIIGEKGGSFQLLINE